MHRGWCRRGRIELTGERRRPHQVVDWTTHNEERTRQTSTAVVRCSPLPQRLLATDELADHCHIHVTWLSTSANHMSSPYCILICIWVTNSTDWSLVLLLSVTYFRLRALGTELIPVSCQSAAADLGPVAPTRVNFNRRLKRHFNLQSAKIRWWNEFMQTGD